jgi:hypothetical protein
MDLERAKEVVDSLRKGVFKLKVVYFSKPTLMGNHILYSGFFDLLRGKEKEEFLKDLPLEEFDDFVSLPEEK